MSSARPSRLAVTNERGIVLAASLLFVVLASVLVLTMMLTTVGERSQSSNVQTAKLSIYAADAGVRTQQQLLANFAKTKLDSCYTAWVAAGSNPAQPIVTAPASVFPAGTLVGPLVASSANPTFTASASVIFSGAEVGPQSQAFNYMYTIQATGSVVTTGKRMVESRGFLRLSATRGSFADYLIFTDQFRTAANDLVWFTSSSIMDGRLHTNDATSGTPGFRFAGQPKFNDEVTQVSANATFFNDSDGDGNSNGYVVTNADNNGTEDVPSFLGGYLRGQGAVPLPANGGQQEGAALGLTLASGASPTSTDYQNKLGSASPPNGIYVVNNGLSVTGGVYVKGNADLVKVFADTALNRQYYQITQGPKSMSIMVDRVTNTTSVWPNLTMAGLPTPYTGVPNGVMYTTGSIAELRGPDRIAGAVMPAIEEYHKALIAAHDDIVIQGDLTCDNFYNNNDVLGIYSSAGAVRIGNLAPDNLNLDAFVMACGTANGEFRVDGFDVGSPRGSVNLRGGCVSKYFGAFYTFDTNGTVLTGYARNFHYDRRGVIPPAYPTVVNFRVSTPTARTLVWREI